MINVLELDGLLDVLWHWRCPAPSPCAQIGNPSLLALSSSAIVAMLISWPSATQSGIVQVLCQAFEEFWAVWVFGTWRARVRSVPWSTMTGLMTDQQRKADSVVQSYADVFVTSTKQSDANATWNKTVAALKKTGLKTDEAKSNCSREWRTDWATIGNSTVFLRN